MNENAFFLPIVHRRWRQDLIYRKLTTKNAEFRQIAANFKEIPIRGMVFFYQ